MARVPAVERGVGAVRLARWHAMGGRYIVSLVVAHATFITWGYSSTDGRNVFGETYTLWTQYADILMATVAAGLLVLVGVVSARAARRRLRYETWHFIHLYTYLAIALAFSHQFSTGEEFINDRLARAAWAALYVVITALLVWFRLVTPVRQFFRHQLRVERVATEGANVISIWISGRHLEEMTPRRHSSRSLGAPASVAQTTSTSEDTTTSNSSTIAFSAQSLSGAPATTSTTARATTTTTTQKSQRRTLMEIRRKLIMARYKLN